MNLDPNRTNQFTESAVQLLICLVQRRFISPPGSLAPPAQMATRTGLGLVKPAGPVQVLKYYFYHISYQKLRYFSRVGVKEWKRKAYSRESFFPSFFCKRKQGKGYFPFYHPILHKRREVSNTLYTQILWILMSAHTTGAPAPFVEMNETWVRFLLMSVRYRKIICCSHTVLLIIEILNNQRHFADIFKLRI